MTTTPTSGTPTSGKPSAGAILVLPTAAADQHGPVAAWMSTAGWASGVRRVLGEAWIVTPSGVIDANAARERGSDAQLAPPESRSLPSRLPTVAKTAIKDLREWRRARRFKIDRGGPWQGHRIAFVWQRHELFHGAGLTLADRMQVPSVLFVPAPIVWQARQWGTNRPGWSSAVERVAEATAFRRATIVAAGSDVVAEQIARLGAAEHRIVVTPTGLDPDLFAERPDPHTMRSALGLQDRLVVGWVGSFRKFHALELAVDALVGIPDATLLLVGDGPERGHIEARARASGVAVVAVGTVAHDRIPGLLSAMDIALVLADSDQSFHYSPLKLTEYLAAGVAVIAPRAGALPAQLVDGEDAVLFTPGDTAELNQQIRRLRDDPTLRARLAAAGSAAALHRRSWDRAVEQVMEAITTVDEAPPTRGQS